jgi:hypothetical protein
MRINPLIKKTTLTGKQRSPRSLIDGLHKPVHNKPQRLGFVKNIDWNVSVTRANVDEAQFAANQ